MHHYAPTKQPVIPPFCLAVLALAMFGGQSVAEFAFAQPALDRAERTVRRQLTQPASPSPTPAQRVAEPGYLGVIADREDGAGVRLREVIAEGPAAKAGLQTGDVITAINGQAVRQNSDMGKILENSPVGAELKFTVNRQNGEQEIPVVLTRRPVDTRLPFGRVPDDPSSADAKPSLPANSVVPGPAPAGPVLGVRAVPVSAEAQRQFNLPDTKGAVVMGVTVGSAAERAGIPVGSIITSIDDQPVTDPDELGRLIREAGTGEEIEVVFLHRGQEFHRRTTLGGVAPLPTRPSQELAPVRPTQPTVGSRLSPNAFGGTTSSPDRVEALEQRVRELEARIARLEAALRQEPDATGSE